MQRRGLIAQFVGQPRGQRIDQVNETVDTEDQKGTVGAHRPAAQRADELRHDQFVLIRTDRAHDVGFGEELLQRDLIVLR